jgi:hypothetical protein
MSYRQPPIRRWDDRGCTIRINTSTQPGEAHGSPLQIDRVLRRVTLRKTYKVAATIEFLFAAAKDDSNLYIIIHITRYFT